MIKSRVYLSDMLPVKHYLKVTTWLKDVGEKRTRSPWNHMCSGQEREKNFTPQTTFNLT